MYQFEDKKRSYAQIKRRVKRIVIGGITFMAAVISIPSSGMETGQYNYSLAASVENVIEKSRFVNDQTARQLFTPALLTSKNSAISKWSNELFDLGKYEDDWDGEGALAVHPDSIFTAQQLMKETGEIIDELSDIYPTPLGTICMEWRHLDATINVEIARKRIAFYCDRFSDGSKVSDYVRSEGVTSELVSSLYEFFA